FALAETTRAYPTASGPVEYVDLGSDSHDDAGQTEAESWLRGNPHKLQLATIGLWTGDAAPLDVAALTVIEQQLDLWTGVIESRFVLGGLRYQATTAAHHERDAVGYKVVGPPGSPVGVRLRFPYGSEAWADASDWSKPDAHTTVVERVTAGWSVVRRLDGACYTVLVHAEGLELLCLGAHDLVFAGEGEAEVVVEFVAGAATPGAVEKDALAARPGLTAAAVVAASARAWASFWSSGACVDLAGSTDERFPELERRIVLSQYLTAVNCAGSLPPAETGLLLNSWRGKFHLEMHLFHAAHFAAWGRPQLLARSLGWYHDVRDTARATAARQGYAGARWPKQVGPDGREAPSSIGPFLAWQQPHLIYLAEMLYRAHPSDEVLERYADLVHDTAEFMTSYAVNDAHGFHLGPPIVPAQESYYATRATARDPTFELAYWSWALSVAAGWWRRRGRTAPPRWSAVADGMARPLIKDRRYAALATPPYLVRDDHPSLLAAYGLVPATGVIEPEVMARTFADVMTDWDWASTWGWDYPVAAMTAARLTRRSGAAGAPGAINVPGAAGVPGAVDALLLDRPKNAYLANGHN